MTDNANQGFYIQQLIMKNTFLNILTCCCLLISAQLQSQNEVFRANAPEAGPAPAIQIGDFTDFKLDNGLTVIVVENHKLPRVSYRLFVDAPVFSEGDKVGTADIAGQLLRAGTSHMSKAEIDEAVDFIGANMSTSANGVFASCITRHQEKLLGIMANVVQSPTFPEEEFEKIQKQTISGLTQGQEDPETIAANVAASVNYGDHPYAETTTIESVENISAEDCRKYYQRYFEPSSSYLVVVGDVTPAKAKELAGEYFSNWSNPKAIKEKEEFKMPKAPSSTEVAFMAKPGAVQSTINITYPIHLRPGADDVIPSRVLDAILGSGFNGRLFMNLREDKGYTYGAYSDLSSDREVGSFIAYANVRNEVTDSAMHQFMFELERLAKEMVTDIELSRAKSMITGSFARSLERPESIARFALNTVRYNLPRDYYPSYLQKLAEVSRADVLEVAQAYIRPANAHLVVVGNKEVAESLQPFDTDGEITYYDAFGNVKQMNEQAVPEGLTPAMILANYVEAIGGAETVKGVEDMTVVMKGNAQGMELTMTQQQKRADKLAIRFEMSGMVVNNTVVNGDKASVSAMGQAQEVDEGGLADLKQQAILFPEAQYIERGYELSIDGMEEVNGAMTYVLKVKSPTGKESLEYYDAANGFKVRAVAAEEGATITTDYLEYTEQDGIKHPKKVSISGMMPIPLVLTVESVELNTGLDDSVFTVEQK